ncbi:MAG TPA: MBL fold metallo-hydrolase [Candidatus Polarisedimenticolaceae bacterium]|nr:MBL fold metallo-hydrolase [Candidatus Polarisedimenticolaceae bacterium]
MRPLEILVFTYGPFAENTYVVVGPGGRSAMVVDPGIGSEPVLDVLRERRLACALIVNTHGHLDHVAGNAAFHRATGAPIAIHAADLPLLENVRLQASLYGLAAEDSPAPGLELVEGAPLPFDGTAFEVIHTPGHTPGGVCLRRGSQMLVGDTLFRGSVGRTDLPGGDWDTLVASIRGKLFALPDDVACYPGHEGETTIGRERRTNPFVGDAAVGDPR